MEQNHKDLLSKKVVFPDSLIRFNSNKKIGSNNKKLIFTGNMNCSPCILRLKEIQSYIEQKTLTNENVDVIYLGLGEFNEYFEYQTKENNFSFDIYGDLESQFINQNNLQNLEKTTFLLNNVNEIILIGDLLTNKKINELFEENLLQ